MPISALIAAALALSAPAASQEIALAAPGGTLHGTLLRPAAPAAEPVLILAGSGPTDRDGNNPAGLLPGTYRLLAEALAERGIPSLRVDKRGVAASMGAAASEEELRIQTYADDARLWAARLRQATGASCAWLLGHSEGALHALLAAREPAGICGLILVSGAGRPLGDVLREQLRANPANAPLLDQAMAAVDALEAGRAVDASALHPALLGLFRPSVQPFLISMLALDPAALLAAYEGSVLVVQGTTDIQTGIADARRLAEARAGVRLAVLEGVNHVLKAAPAERDANIATYLDPNLPLGPGVAETIAGFILEHRGH